MIGQEASRANPVPGTARPAQDRSLPTQEELSLRRRRTRDRLLTIVSPLLMVVLWELLVRARLLDARFFPAPSSIVNTFGQLIASGQLALDLRDTLTRVF